MAHLVEVAFKGNRKEFFLWQGENAPSMHAPVIVEADRGEDLGRINAVGDLAELRARGCTHGIGKEQPTQKALRVATPDELGRLKDVREQDEIARREAMALVKTHALQMKLTDAEWRWDRRKLTMYFSADRRVDFRALVRDLAGKFRTRIELKQIGVRDEAKRLDGVGRCGKQYCSASWLPELRPVNLGLAKDQKLSLNPTQISGACGRLMCCLRYEHDWYVETRRLFPKEGKVVMTALGEEKVVLNDLFRERVSLRRVADGEARIISLEQLNKELRGEPIETDAAIDALPSEDLSDELLAMTDTIERPVPQMFRAPRPSERPVKLERAEAREATPAPPRQERPPRGDRPRNPQRQGASRSEPARQQRSPRTEPSKPSAQGGRPQAPQQRNQPQDNQPQSSAPQSSAPQSSEPHGGEPQSSEQSRGDRPRSRRRRGRRGGRRGGGEGGGATPPQAPGPAE